MDKNGNNGTIPWSLYAVADGCAQMYTWFTLRMIGPWSQMHHKVTKVT
jgi:hypothetical protein